MSDSYTQGTVSPLLPLLPRHRVALEMVDSLDADLPPGTKWNEDAAPRLVIENQSAFEMWAEGHVSAEYSREEVMLAAAALISILSELGDVDFGLSIEHIPRDPHYVDDLGRPVWYLFCRMSCGSATLSFLEWVLQGMPEDIAYIEFEYAMTCTRLLRGEFGGGAWHIRRDRTETIGTGSWLARQARGGLNDLPDRTEAKNLFARAAAFMEDDGSISDQERAELLEDLLGAVAALGAEP